MVQIKVVDRIETHILHSETFFFSEYCAIYGVTSKNGVAPERPLMTIWCMLVDAG
jgi:hypothetical protein